MKPDTPPTARLERAAEIQGRSLTAFVVAATDDAARRTIEQTGIIRLSVEDQRQIAEANARRAYYAHREELHRKRVRYIAVRTSRTPESKGQASCMVWDTQSQQLVGNSVYDCKSKPASGSTAKFDSYSAEYVGS